ncbi:hypothetical protein AO82_03117, partial [Mycobacterium tuberculosis M2130]
MVDTSAPASRLDTDPRRAHVSQHRASGHRNTSARVTRLLRILSNAGPRDLR